MKNIILNGIEYMPVPKIENVIELDYEILSFIVIENKNIWVLNEHKMFKLTSIGSHTLKHMLKCVKEGSINIHSVKRLSDGEVFTISDEEKEIGIITIFFINCYNDMVICKDDARRTFLRDAVKVKPPTVLLTTEDGVEITDPYTQLFGVDSRFSKMWNLTAKNYINSNITLFTNRKAMDEYVLEATKRVILTTEDGVEITNGEQVLFGIISYDLTKKADIIANNHQYAPNGKYFSTEAARDKYKYQNKPVTVTYLEIVRFLNDESDFGFDTRLVERFFKSKLI